MRVKESLDISAPAPAVWQVLGEDFANISDWAGSVFTSSLDGDPGVGVTRTCTLAKSQIVKEEMVKFDRQSHALTCNISSG